jgi:tRNA(fMet)-specific endonuclease VapC
VVILDTDTLTLVQRASGEEYRRLTERLNNAQEPIAVTIVTFEEQLRGWLAFIRRAKTEAKLIDGYTRLHALLDDFQTRPVVDYDARAAAEFRRLRKAKIRIGTLDLRIASIALVYDATLVSRNLNDFTKVPGLRVEDWTVPSQHAE